ncbi:glycerophosphodiester phosphodiesterase family protein [Thermobacillus sp. ZCTH02-B1]|uniref:glycerophosphodiester phosphodiesterase n=1 Tax=Thermobacillus sp. ZCTH02-B1 TaxID=1858795 RepID=UPI0025D70EA6|nr:glycerophosphodiester phosphodiesterase family protein [Thermobacillus sp. ZCTH02-B1]
MRGTWHQRRRLRILSTIAAVLTLALVQMLGGAAGRDARHPVRSAVAQAPRALHPGQGDFSVRPLIVAHRGASKYAPENTMAAFRLAREMGADYIELDVRMTRDGRLIVLHDETVDRTTDGTGRADRMTFGEILDLDAGGWFSAAFRGERVPSLEEVLDGFAGAIGLILELKQPSAYPGIEHRLAGMLAERGLNRPDSGLIIQSFDTRSLRRMRDLVPDVPIAVLVRPGRRVTTQNLAAYRTYADAVSLPFSLARKPVIDRIRAHGLAVLVWDVRGERQLDRLLAYGVDGILTNDPMLPVR